MKLTLLSIHEEVSNVRTLAFKPAEEITWQAGQYMHYVLPHDHPDERGTERWFTISAAPFEKEIRITTRDSGDRASSFKKALFALPVGVTIESDGPEGDFIASEPMDNFVFIAGGIGITPFRSMLLDLDHKGAVIKGVLYYANRDQNIVFKDELEALTKKHPDFMIKYVMSPAQIDEAYLRTEIADLEKPIFYISGPEPMVKSLEQTMKVIGVPEEYIKLDDFPGYDWPHSS